MSRQRVYQRSMDRRCIRRSTNERQAGRHSIICIWCVKQQDSFTQCAGAVQGGMQARTRPQEKEMPRETLERIAAQLGSLDGEPLQACSSYTPAVPSSEAC